MELLFAAAVGAFTAFAPAFSLYLLVYLVVILATPMLLQYFFEKLAPKEFKKKHRQSFAKMNAYVFIFLASLPVVVLLASFR